jgi:hypothetical protein
MSPNDELLAGEPTLVVLRRLGNDQRSLRGQVPARLQARRTAQSARDRDRADRMLAQLAERIRAKQEELVATVAALPPEERARHEEEVRELLAIYGRGASAV